MASSSNSGSSSSESHSSRSSSTGYSRSSDSDFSSSSRSSSRGLTTVMDDMAGAFEKGETVEGAGAVLSEALDQMEAEEVGQEQAASEHETASGERAATDTAGFAAEVEAMIEEASNEDEGEAAQEAEEGPEEEENPPAEGEEGLEEGEIPPAAGEEGNAVVFAQRNKQEKGYFKWLSVDLGGQAFAGARGRGGRKPGRLRPMDAFSARERQFVRVPHPLFKRIENVRGALLTGNFGAFEYYPTREL